MTGSLDIERMRAMAAAGRSLSEAGAALGLTASAVAARAKRAGIRFGGGVPLAKKSTAPIEPVPAVTIGEVLPARGCQWFVGGANPLVDWRRQRCCGAERAEGTVYCAEHMKLGHGGSG